MFLFAEAAMHRNLSNVLTLLNFKRTIDGYGLSRMTAMLLVIVHKWH